MNNFVVAHNQVSAWLATIDPEENKTLCENNSSYICSSIAKKKPCCQGNKITEWFKVINYSALSGTNGTSDAISTCLVHTSQGHCDWEAIQKLVLRTHLGVENQPSVEKKPFKLLDFFAKKGFKMHVPSTLAKYEIILFILVHRMRL